LERALRQLKLQAELEQLRERAGTDGLAEMVTSSPVMDRVRELVRRVASSDTSVLITGESGTGKELVARALHTQSSRTGPFLAINCAAIPERLLESELFGHVRGAFTDARTDRAGLFTEAGGGTLFLDEIGELPLGMQAKILRALQERKVRPVGGSREVGFDARVITATNRDLELEISAQRFREDLYYRINVVCIEVPPLRERGSDISLLAQYFLERAAKRSGARPLGIGHEVSERLTRYNWPGNVRELENCVERIVALSRYDEVTLDDLPQKIRDHMPGGSSADGDEPGYLPSMAVMEERHLRKVLDAVGGSTASAAKILELAPEALSRRLEALSIKSQ
jgi:two-component system response regulator HydG